MQLTTFENTSVITTTASLKVAEIEPTLFAFNLTARSKQSTNDGTFKTPTVNPGDAVETQGFVDSKNLELLKKGRAYKTRKLVVMDAVAREDFRTRGWNRVCQSGRYDHLETSNAWDAVTAQGFNADDLVQMQHDRHMLVDRTGAALPVGITFDYLSGGIDNGRYALKILARHLLSRGDCVIAGSRIRGSSFASYDTPATTVEEAIQRVPNYNQSQGCNSTVMFTWAPTAEVYTKMWNHCLAMEPNYPSTHMHQAIFELDLLGLRAARATLFDSFHKSTAWGDSPNDGDE